MGAGTSEVQALIAEVRALDARVVACEKDLVRLGRWVSELRDAAIVPGVVSAEAAPAMPVGERYLRSVKARPAKRGGVA